jgi:hypothetical protein
MGGTPRSATTSQEPDKKATQAEEKAHHVLGVQEGIVDSNDLNMLLSGMMEDSLENQATDATETVDTDLDSARHLERSRKKQTPRIVRIEIKRKNTKDRVLRMWLEFVETD